MDSSACPHRLQAVEGHVLQLDADPSETYNRSAVEGRRLVFTHSLLCPDQPNKQVHQDGRTITVWKSKNCQCLSPGFQLSETISKSPALLYSTQSCQSVKMRLYPLPFSTQSYKQEVITTCGQSFYKALYCMVKTNQSYHFHTHQAPCRFPKITWFKNLKNFVLNLNQVLPPLSELQPHVVL